MELLIFSREPEFRGYSLTLTVCIPRRERCSSWEKERDFVMVIKNSVHEKPITRSVQLQCICRTAFLHTELFLD